MIIKILTSMKLWIIFIITVLYMLAMHRKNKINKLKINLESQLAQNEANETLRKVAKEIDFQEVNEREHIKNRNYFNNRKDL